jgi:hypothetical protein
MNSLLLISPYKREAFNQFFLVENSHKKIAPNFPVGGLII